MNGAESFFAMGGYAAYVWPSLLVTGLVMLVLFLASRRRLKEAQRTLDRLEAELPDRETRRARRSAQGGGESA
ncbi:heme exporter protein CcmD [Limibacillus halophilus]|jgi:heme exporter protein D